LSISGLDAATVSFDRADAEPYILAAYGDTVFFTAGPPTDGGAPVVNAVLAHQVDASAQTATIVTSGEQLGGYIAFVRDKIYWNALDRGGVLRRSDLDGGNAEDFALAPGIEGVLDSSGTQIFWMTRVSYASGDRIFLWGCDATTTPCRPLHLADMTGDAKLSGLLPVGIALAAGDGWLYWTEPGHNLIKRVSIKMH
jgi:hypothetical protein